MLKNGMEYTGHIFMFNHMNFFARPVRRTRCACVGVIPSKTLCRNRLLERARSETAEGYQGKERNARHHGSKIKIKMSQGESVRVPIKKTPDSESSPLATS